jgi:hypothetical protein
METSALSVIGVDMFHFLVFALSCVADIQNEVSRRASG